MFYYCDNLTYLDISNFRIENSKNYSIFYSLPEYGKILVNEEFVDKIYSQIPKGWEIEVKKNITNF